MNAWKATLPCSLDSLSNAPLLLQQQLLWSASSFLFRMRSLDIRSRSNGHHCLSFSKLHHILSNIVIFIRQFCIFSVLYSIPLPSETNIVLRYYLDWFDQLLFTVAYYTMILTNALFFIGTCIYIGGMEEDLKLTLDELNCDSRMKPNQLFVEIAFHNHLIE